MENTETGAKPEIEPSGEIPEHTEAPATEAQEIDPAAGLKRALERERTDRREAEKRVRQLSRQKSEREEELESELRELRLEGMRGKVVSEVIAAAEADGAYSVDRGAVEDLIAMVHLTSDNIHDRVAHVVNKLKRANRVSTPNNSSPVTGGNYSAGEAGDAIRRDPMSAFRKRKY